MLEAILEGELPNTARAKREEAFPEGPSTQYFRFLVPKTIFFMVFGTRVLKYWVLGPSGFAHGAFETASTHPRQPSCRAHKRRQLDHEIVQPVRIIRPTLAITSRHTPQGKCVTSLRKMRSGRPTCAPCSKRTRNV